MGMIHRALFVASVGVAAAACSGPTVTDVSAAPSQESVSGFGFTPLFTIPLEGRTCLPQPLTPSYECRVLVVASSCDPALRLPPARQEDVERFDSVDPSILANGLRLCEVPAHVSTDCRRADDVGWCYVGSDDPCGDWKDADPRLHCPQSMCLSPRVGSLVSGERQAYFGCDRAR